MILENSYFYEIEALTPEICQKIIDIGTNQIKLKKNLGLDTQAKTFGGSEKSDNKKTPASDLSLDELSKKFNKSKQEILKTSYIRDSEVSWISENWIYDLLYPKILNANKNAGWNFDLTYPEPMQFTVYHPGGFYGWHSDGGSDYFARYKKHIPGVTGYNVNNEKDKRTFGYVNDEKQIGLVRKLSLTINLNKPGEYEGGNLKFDFGPHSEGERFHECEEIRPQGSIIFFPSFIPHTVTPITKGTRYSLVLWVDGPPFK